MTFLFSESPAGLGCLCTARMPPKLSSISLLCYRWSHLHILPQINKQTKNKKEASFSYKSEWKVGSTRPTIVTNHLMIVQLHLSASGTSPIDDAWEAPHTTLHCLQGGSMRGTSKKWLLHFFMHHTQIISWQASCQWWHTVAREELLSFLLGNVCIKRVSHKPATFFTYLEHRILEWAHEKRLRVCESMPSFTVDALSSLPLHVSLPLVTQEQWH